MALFAKKTKKTTAIVHEDVVPVQDLSRVIVRPRITEKASMKVAENVYVFDVAARATKPQIKAAFVAHYKVTPISVRVVNTKGKETRNMRTGRVGFTSASRKAYIILKKGDTISIT
jgi:large subunit ribosomal protein L23